MGETLECEHCGRTFEVADTVGRPRKYCRRSCRQRAFERRRHEGDLAWGDARLVQMARELAEHEDRVDEALALVDELRADLDDGVDLEPAEVLERVEEGLRALRSSSG